MLRVKTDVAPVVRPAQGTKQVLAGLVLAVAGTLAVSAWAQAPGAASAAQPGAGRGGPAMHGMHDMGGMHRMHGQRGSDGHGFGGHGFFRGGPEQVDRAVDRLLQGLNASDAQRSQVRQIARAAATDLRALHEASRGLREQGQQLFAAPVVDARAVEALRQKRVAQHDQASKRMTQAMLDVSAVLSPEQRATLVERMKEHQQRMKARRGAASAPAR